MTKHTILFLAANPLGTDRLALDEEARAIQEELERSGHRDQFELVTRWAARPLDLLRELRKLRPTIVHFSGHGGRGELRPGDGPRRDVLGDAHVAAGEPPHGLFFQGPDGRPQLVTPDALRETFGAAGSSVKLVVLSACYSEAQAEALLAHVDCVAGMGGSIRDDAARSFAIGFYGGLGERQSIAAAYKQGCAAISLEGLSDGRLPQLYVRDGGVEQIFPIGISTALITSTRKRRGWLSFKVAVGVGGSIMVWELSLPAGGDGIAGESRDLRAPPGDHRWPGRQAETAILTLEDTMPNAVADASLRSDSPTPNKKAAAASFGARTPIASTFVAPAIPRDCKGADAGSPMCSYRGTLRRIDGKPIVNTELELIGTDCIAITSELGIFDFKTCDSNQTWRLKHPRIFLHLPNDKVCREIPLEQPPLVTEVRIDLETCYRRHGSATIQSRLIPP